MIGLYVPLSSEEAGVYLPDRSWTPTTAVGKSPAGVQMRGNASTPGGHLGFPRATLPAAPEPDGGWIPSEAVDSWGAKRKKWNETYKTASRSVVRLGQLTSPPQPWPSTVLHAHLTYIRTILQKYYWVATEYSNSSMDTFFDVYCSSLWMARFTHINYAMFSSMLTDPVHNRVTWIHIMGESELISCMLHCNN